MAAYNALQLQHKKILLRMHVFVITKSDFIITFFYSIIIDRY